MTKVLDPRPARKLTSRELARVLGSILGGLQETKHPQSLRTAFLKAVAYWKTLHAETYAPQPVVEVTQDEHLLSVALFSMMRGLAELGEPGAMDACVQFWTQPEPWKLFVADEDAQAGSAS